MSILDKAQIGNSVQVNLELSKDRLNKETVEAINFSPVGKIRLQNNRWEGNWSYVRIIKWDRAMVL